MSDLTVPLEDDLPRWILDEPTEADLAPGGGLEDCDGAALAPPGQGDGDDELPAGIIVDHDGMDGVDLPDAAQAEADHGDWSAADVDNDYHLDDQETDDDG